MMYQDVTRFLKRHLKTPSTEYTWSGMDNFLLLNFLQGRYSDEHIDTNAMDIREAFRDFLEPIGSALVRYAQGVGIHYKIFPYHVEPSQSMHLKTLVQIIRGNRRAIEYPYNGRDDQMALLGKIRRDINSHIAETTEKVNKKELVRYAIKQALELSERDVVVHLKKKYVVKLFQKNTFLSHSNHQLEEDESQSLIIKEEELKECYDELFKDMKVQDFLEQAMSTLFSTTLDFQKINNDYYEKNVLSLVKRQIMQELATYISDNDEYIKQLAGYILKVNLILIHEYIAIEIFEKITEKDINARNFLNYYTGQIYVENGKRYIIPEIVTEDGKRWNINSLMSTASVWLRTRGLLLKTKVQIQNVEQSMNEIMPDYSSAKQQLDTHNHEYNIYLKKFKEVNQKVEDAMGQLNSEIKTAMAITRESALEQQIRKDKQLLKEIKQQISVLASAKMDKEKKFLDIQKVHTDLTYERTTLSQKVQAFERDLALGSDAFHSILSSVVKALMKRKTELD